MEKKNIVPLLVIPVTIYFSGFENVFFPTDKVNQKSYMALMNVDKLMFKGELHPKLKLNMFCVLSQNYQHFQCFDLLKF